MSTWNDPSKSDPFEHDSAEQQAPSAGPGPGAGPRTPGDGEGGPSPSPFEAAGERAPFEPPSFEPPSFEPPSFEPPSFEPSPSQPPPSQPPPSTRRLSRSSNRVVGGVCAGIAEYTGIDVSVVRIITVLFMLMGHGLVLYLAGWLLMPTAGGGPSAFDRWRARRRR